MKKNKLLIALTIAACSGAAIANDKIDYSFGLKSWNHKLKDDVTTQNTSATILSATAKKGNYFVATSFFMPTTYGLSSTAYSVRKDTDLAFGYSINPNISALIGTKRLSVDHSSSSDSTLNVTYIGANGFTSIGEETFLFGQLTHSLNTKESTVGYTYPAGYKSTYSSLEAGLGYVLNKNTQITGGYRKQIFNPNVGSGTALSGIIFGISITP